MNPFDKKGITVLELMAVVVILTIFISIALPQFSKMRENQIIKSATEDVISVINKAKSETLASVDSSEYGIHFQADKIIIFKGKVYSAIDPNNESTDISSPASISGINLTGGVYNLYFNRLSGVPSVSGTVTVSTPSLSKVVQISNIGLVSIN
jgi:type II secretory pathway pseudopilin PulG